MPKFKIGEVVLVDVHDQEVGFVGDEERDMQLKYAQGIVSAVYFYEDGKYWNYQVHINLRETSFMHSTARYICTENEDTNWNYCEEQLHKLS